MERLTRDYTIVTMYDMTDTPPQARHGEDLIKMERWRQVHAKGHGPEHDAEHSDGSLVRAAQTYMNYAEMQRIHPDFSFPGERYAETEPWPWRPKDFKPSYAVRNLVKAGALIAAEIDRLLAEPDAATDRCPECGHGWGVHGRDGCHVNGSKRSCRCGVANHA